MTEQAPKSVSRIRSEIDEQYKWDVSNIYPDWHAWQSDMEVVKGLMDEFVAMKATLQQGGQQILKAYQLNDKVGMMAYKLYRYPQLQFDVDQRNNDIQARLQQVQNLFAEFGVKSAWFTPEILTIDQETMMHWIDQTSGLESYRFPITEIYRNQNHVLDESGEQLLSFGSRFRSTPAEIFRALSTADVQFKTIELSTGESVTISYAGYSKILNTNRNQEDRRRAFEAMYSVFNQNKNTYAALYNGICQRDWAQAQSRNYATTAEAALDSDAVPVSVLETLIQTAKDGTAPLQRYHRLRKKVLRLESYHLYDGSVPMVDYDKSYPYDDVAEMIINSVAILGTDYQQTVRKALTSRWIDVYENEGKRSGAYSAGVYGVHPYMLLNYTDTINDVFTLAHELGHTLHTVLSDTHQPFATSGYTIFVAEVASTTTEALLLDYMLKHTDDPKERILLLQRAINGIVGTFYSQALFADYELQAHRLVENGHPITADALNALYMGLTKEFYGDAIKFDQLYEVTWARIPHFFNSPYYVYQYATCYASSAKLMNTLLSSDPNQRDEAVEKYLALLKSGGNDHPMKQLQKAGIDLNQPDTVLAVVSQLNALIDQLEQALESAAII